MAAAPGTGALTEHAAGNEVGRGADVAGAVQGSGEALLSDHLTASSAPPVNNGGMLPPALVCAPAPDHAVESPRQEMQAAGEQQLPLPVLLEAPAEPLAAAAPGMLVGGTDARVEESGRGGHPQDGDGGQGQAGQPQGAVVNVEEPGQEQQQPQQQDGGKSLLGKKRIAGSRDGTEAGAVSGMETKVDGLGDVADRPAKRHKGWQGQGGAVTEGEAADGGQGRGAGAAEALESAGTGEGGASTVGGRSRRARSTSGDGGAAGKEHADEALGQDAHPEALLPQEQQQQRQQRTVLGAPDGGQGPDAAMLPDAGLLVDEGATEEATTEAPPAAAPASTVSPVREEEAAIATTTAGAPVKTPKPPRAPKGRKGGKGPAAQAQAGEPAGPPSGASPADPDAPPFSPTAHKPPHLAPNTQEQQPPPSAPPPAPATTGKRRRGAAVPDGDGAAAISPRYQQASPSAAADAPPPPPPSSVTRRTSSRRAPDAAAATSPPPPAHTPTTAPTGQVVVSISRNFSERDRKQFAAMVAQLKGLVADEARADHGEFTHLLMPSNNFKPSMKVLAALASGRPLLDASWLRACAEAGRWLPPAEQHAATDSKEERARRFSVWGAHVAKEEHGPFLQGHTFWVTKERAEEDAKLSASTGAASGAGSKVKGGGAGGSNKRSSAGAAGTTVALPTGGLCGLALVAKLAGAEVLSDHRHVRPDTFVLGTGATSERRWAKENLPGGTCVYDKDAFTQAVLQQGLEGVKPKYKV